MFNLSTKCLYLLTCKLLFLAYIHDILVCQKKKKKEKTHQKHCNDLSFTTRQFHEGIFFSSPACSRNNSRIWGQFSCRQTLKRKLPSYFGNHYMMLKLWLKIIIEKGCVGVWRNFFVMYKICKFQLTKTFITKKQKAKL